jgi:hypothetical protein
MFPAPGLSDPRSRAEHESIAWPQSLTDRRDWSVAAAGRSSGEGDARERRNGHYPCMTPQDPSAVGRAVLPPPDPAFRGRIEEAFKDSEADYPEPLRAPAGAPNVLLVMGDDIGYGHMSGFGGPANTPTFDRLAKRGLSFTNFHTTAVCAASRAALLTGRNSHNVAMGGVPEISSGFPGYNGNIPRSDIGHAKDLAAKHPDKLAEMQALFDAEAHTYNVYPMANDFNEIVVAERPRLVSGDWASYGPGTIRLPEDAAINIKNRSFSLVAEVDNPDDNAEGMLVTLGGETGGYALFVLEGKPTFAYNWLGVEQYTVTASEPLPQGECTIVFDFAYDGGGPGKGGTGTLAVNGKTVAEGRIDKTVPVYFSTDDTFDVGEDWGTPMSDTYEPPFAFTGNLKRVTVHAKSP